MSIMDVSGKLCFSLTALPEVDPVEAPTWTVFVARATSIPLWIECIHAEQEKGITTPVVPRMDMPPTIPSCGFHVLSANSLPPGTDISTSTFRSE